jgi:hypothetical protein
MHAPSEILDVPASVRKPARPITHMILFLDFDGVLHTDPCAERQRLFENAPRLDASLAAFPEVAIVLSTAWRTLYPLGTLMGLLPEGLSRRVVGITPNFGDFISRPALVPYRRHAECEHWLVSQDHISSPWIALDDRCSWFEPYCETLVGCDPDIGFDDDAAARLHTKLVVQRARLSSQVDMPLC